MDQDRFRTYIESKYTLLAAIILCGCLLYANSLHAIFTFDDMHMIKNNLFIKDLRHIPLFFKGVITSYPIPQGMFRPLLMVSFSVNYFISGLDPLSYHIFNILLHIFNVLLFCVLLRALKTDIPRGLVLLIALVFCSHPLNTEAVTYISSRSDLLVTSFILLAVLAHVKNRRGATLAAYLGALLSKENALILPLLLAAYDLLFSRSRPARPRTRYAFYAALAVMSLVYWGYRNHVMGLRLTEMGLVYSPVIRSVQENLLTQAAVSLYYLRLFFWPYPLTIHHVFPLVQSFTAPLALVSYAGFAALLGAALFFARRQPLISFGLFWYGICLMPKFYAFLNVLAAEHHFYLPGIGVYCVLAGILSFAYRKRARTLAAALLAVVAIFAVLAAKRNYEWGDSFAFWRSAVHGDSRSSAAHNNLGLEFLKQGKYPEALAEFQIAVAQSSGSSSTSAVKRNALANVGLVYRAQGKFPEALAELQKAQAIEPTYYGIYQNIGMVYLDMGRKEDAEAAWKKGLEFYPYAHELLTDLGFFYAAEGRDEESGEYFQKALAVSPDSALAALQLGKLYERRKEPERALVYYRRAVANDPRDPVAHCALGTLLSERQDGEGLRYLLEAIRLDPSYAEAHNNLAVLYASFDPPLLEEARDHAREALRLGYPVNGGFLAIIGLDHRSAEKNPSVRP